MSVEVITVIDVERIEELNWEHRAFEDAKLRSEVARDAAVEHAARAGQLLTEIKAELPHGSWLSWLDENFAASADTAQLYMRIAANPERIPDLDGIGDAKRQLAKPRAQSPKDAAAVVSELEDDDEPATRAANERHVEIVELPSAQSERECDRIRHLLTEAEWKMTAAFNDGLARHARAELLREAEVRAREAFGRLGELAFTFER